MLHSITPWTKLTRQGVPEFRVSRLPVTAGGRTLHPGDPVPADFFVHRRRLRQFYERRLIEPVDVVPAGVSRRMPRHDASIPAEVAFPVAAPSHVVTTAVVEVLPDLAPLPVELTAEDIANIEYVPRRGRSGSSKSKK